MKTNDALDLYIADMEAARAAGKRPRAMKALLGAARRYPGGEFNEPDEDVLVFSDLHLGHHNIIRYANRPCRHGDEMNSTLWAKTRPHDCTGWPQSRTTL